MRIYYKYFYYNNLKHIFKVIYCFHSCHSEHRFLACIIPVEHVGSCGENDSGELTVSVDYAAYLEKHTVREILALVLLIVVYLDH